MKHSTEPSVSIIVPIYKAEQFLTQCVDSILKQSEQDFELILIDDGSPDQSPAMCDEYSKNDPRVRVIHKPNGGVSAARNTGLDLARGAYVVFIDSDDYVDGNYLEEMLRAYHNLEHSGNELIITDYQPFDENKEWGRHYPEPFIMDFTKETATAEAFRNLVFDIRIFPPYCKLYRRDLIEKHHLRFKTTLKTAEDFDFNIRYLKDIDVVSYLPFRSYHYRVAYKSYVPSNHGILGSSEIESAHIMANGITELANRMGVYREVEEDLVKWFAWKHYFNRMPMLFAPNKKIGRKERKQLYERLTADPVYRGLYKEGIRLMEKSKVRWIGCHADRFDVWNLFYRYQQLRSKKHQAK